MTAEEVRKLAEAIDPYYRTLIYVAAYCGLRAGELLALRGSDVDLLRGSVARALKDLNGSLSFGPTKSHAERTVSLPRFLRAMLSAHLETVEDGSPDALVFPGPQGGPMRHGNFYRRHFRPTVVGDPENGIPAALPERLAGLRFHDLRHTCASLLIAEGAHPKLIQERLGHSSITITLDRYGHLFPRLEAALWRSSMPRSRRRRLRRRTSSRSDDDPRRRLAPPPRVRGAHRRGRTARIPGAKQGNAREGAGLKNGTLGVPLRWPDCKKIATA